MGKVKKTYSYIEWLSADEMRQASLGWLSELHFCNDEQAFLNNLIRSYTVQLIDKKIFTESKKLINELSIYEKRLETLAEQIQAHESLLKIMLDEIDQFKMEKAYLETHNDLTVEINEYLENYRDLKKRLFILLSQVLRSQKQKRLLN